MKMKIAFIGVGNMAGAIIGGLADETLCLYDKDTSKYNRFSERKPILAESASDAVSYADCIFFAVKPQNFDELLSEIASSDTDLSGKLFVTIAAGITIEYIEKMLGNVAVIRCMPNTPLLISKGVTGLCRNGEVDDRRFSAICRLFSSLGEVLVLSEDKINALTAATSSAPAYVYLFIKAIYDSGFSMGLDDKNMQDYICRMVIGSAEMLLQSGKTPAELIRMVTSPNGTTERAMKVLDERKFCKIVDEAMIACRNRADELAK